MDLDQKSPITHSSNIKKISTIPASEIIDLYKKKVKIDVSRFFQDTKEVMIYECQDTGYRFYYPFNISGDSRFYEELARQEWYYHQGRWEHYLARDLVQKADKILEVGCGYGVFLRLIENKEVLASGLELNENAVNIGKKEGLKIINEDVSVHMEKFENYYDLVCSFQVLEHVTDVKSFLDCKIGCLKPEGKLVIAVPNNDSFIGNNRHESRCLNQPPHHVGLWTIQSLKNLENVFPIKLLKIYKEPLSEKTQLDIAMWNYFLIFRSEILARIIWKFRLHKILRPIFSKSGMDGHSVMAVFQKL